MRRTVAVITESELVRVVSKLLQQFSLKDSKVFGSGTNTCCPSVLLSLFTPNSVGHSGKFASVTTNHPRNATGIKLHGWVLLSTFSPSMHVFMSAVERSQDCKCPRNMNGAACKIRNEAFYHITLWHVRVIRAGHFRESVFFFFLTVKSMNDFLQFCYGKARCQHLESFRPGWHRAPRENRWHAHDSKLESYHWLSECSDGWPAASSILAHCMVCQLESGRLVLGRFWMKAWMWKLESKSCGKLKRALLKGIPTMSWWDVMS